MQIVDGWLDTATEINCMHKSMSRSGYRPSHIVVHGTAGGSSAQNIGYYFRDSTVQASTHFVIGRDGVIVQCVSCDVAAWGNGLLLNPRIAGLPDGNGNLWTISIELVKPSTNNSDIPTDAQYIALIELVSLLCATYGIAKRYGDGKSGIIAHGDLDSVNRSGCPGTFDWARLITGIQGDADVAVTLSDPIMSMYLEDSRDGKWRVKGSSVQIWGDIRDFYCKYGGVAVFGLPLTGELDDVVPGCKVTVCERAIIVFDPERKNDSPPIEGTCYLLHIDTGKGQAYLAQPLITSLSAKLSASEALVKDLEAKLAEATDANVEALKAQLAEVLKDNAEYKIFAAKVMGANVQIDAASHDIATAIGALPA